MPRFDKSTNVSHTTVSGFSFSAASLKDLDDVEYTVVTIVVDVSGSVSGFERNLEACIKEAIKGCKNSHGVNKIFLRIVAFNDSIQEIHGFKLLRQIDEADYDGTLHPRGSTALNDATLNALEASEKIVQDMGANDCYCNAVVYIMTDGCENFSTTKDASKIKDTIQRLRRDENLSGVLTVLVRVGEGTWAGVKDTLDEFKLEAGIDEDIDIADTSASSLGKLGQLLSHSISSASANIQSGNLQQSASALQI